MHRRRHFLPTGTLTLTFLPCKHHLLWIVHSISTSPLSFRNAPPGLDSITASISLCLTRELFNNFDTMDNPAVTATAAQRLHSREPHQHGNRETVTTSQPSGEEFAIEKPPQDDSSDVVVSKYDQGWRRIVRNFSPSWFSVTMGTGICATILITIPWKADWLYYLSIVFFVLNVCLFSMAFTASFLRYTIWYDIVYETNE